MCAAKFDGKILIIGCGAVSQCMLPLLMRHIQVDPANVVVLDFMDNRDKIAGEIARGVRYVQQRILPQNYREVLAAHAGRGDLIIDLAWNIDCVAMLEWCRENSVLYINTSVEVWDPFADARRDDPRAYTLYARQMSLKALVHKWGHNFGPSAIVDHGANPGLVSHFTKRALTDIASRIVREKPGDPRRECLEIALAEDNYGKLAQLTGTQVVHISERDTQITAYPKRPNEFVNTWSIAGLYEEGMAPAEMGWGTHERELPRDAFTHEEGPGNQICLSTLGVNAWARSWVPSGEIVGMIIRHGEAYGISDRLTVWQGDRAVYRPTVHYVYCPCDSTIASLHELKMRQYDLQNEQRIMSEDIVSGQDELGVLLMGHDFKSWWCGSVLDIHRTRELAPGQNATTLQVAISVIAGAIWMIRHPACGLSLPDDINHREILDVALPYLGDFVSRPVDWTPFDNLDTKFTRYGCAVPATADCWQFKSFRL